MGTRGGPGRGTETERQSARKWGCFLELAATRQDHCEIYQTWRRERHQAGKLQRDRKAEAPGEQDAEARKDVERVWQGAWGLCLALLLLNLPMCRMSCSVDCGPKAADSTSWLEYMRQSTVLTGSTCCKQVLLPLYSSLTDEALGAGLALGGYVTNCSAAAWAPAGPPP